jgi:putative hydrolase of the HAD superfamily
MKKMKFQVIIFDADGMVINGAMFSEYLEKKHSIPYALTLPFFEGIFQKCLIGQADLKKIIRPYLKKWGWQKNVDEFLQLWFETEDNIDQRMAEIIDNLKRKGLNCILATNQEKYRTAYMKNKMGFNKLFSQVFSSAEIGHKKPEEQFFQYILGSLKNTKKDKILFWDDQEKNIKGARKFGFKARLYKDFNSFENYFKKLV